MPSQTRNILVISDLHCGSIYGLMPPDFVSDTGAKISLNAGQTYLWKCWAHFCEEVAQEQIDAVVVNGDAIDGEQRKNQKSELHLALLADQTRAASECLKYLASHINRDANGYSKPKWYFVIGTPYHDSEGGREVEVLASLLNGTAYASTGPGRMCKSTLDLDIDGVVLNFHHGISGGQNYFSRTGAIDKEAVYSALTKVGKQVPADAVIRSHLHYYVHVEHEDKHGFITPCWELSTGFMTKNSPYKMTPSLGGLIVRVDPEAKRAGEDPISARKILYKLPPRKAVKL